MRIGVLIPTVTGREEYLSQACVTHLPLSLEVEWHLAIELDHPTCHEAWVAGIDRLLARGVDYALITCDDFTAVGSGYFWGALNVCDAGGIACPILYNRSEGERWESSRADGEPGELARCTRSPNMFAAAQAEAIFAVYRELEPMQYYGDFLLGDIGYRLGFEPRIAPGFAFRHWWAQVGRHTDAQNEADHERYQRALARLDHLIGARA